MTEKLRESKLEYFKMELEVVQELFLRSMDKGYDDEAKIWLQSLTALEAKVKELERTGEDW